MLKTLLLSTYLDVRARLSISNLRIPPDRGYIFNHHSYKANVKFLYFVVCLQQFIKHIEPHVQPGHFNVTFLPYVCTKVVVNLSYSSL